jgi:hypothetical protein
MFVNKKDGLEVNPDKTKCVFMSHHQNAGQNFNIKQIIEPFLIMKITNI